MGSLKSLMKVIILPCYLRLGSQSRLHEMIMLFMMIAVTAIPLEESLLSETKKENSTPALSDAIATSEQDMSLISHGKQDKDM